MPKSPSPAPGAAEKDGSIRSLARGLELLDCFDEEHLTLSLTDFANRTGLSVSTISRILQTLVKMGYLNREIDRKYTLGNQVFRLMRVLSNSSNLRATARPILENLRDIFNETASLYVVRDDMRVCLESVESTQALYRSVQVGELLPLYRGAVGYMLLAWLPHQQRTRIAKEHPHLSEAMFSDIRKAGYVINDGIHEPGVFAIAAPVFNAQGVNLGAIAVSGPSFRINEATRRELIEAIQIYSKLISKAQGYEG